jgi:hypothetical protein
MRRQKISADKRVEMLDRACACIRECGGPDIHKNEYGDITGLRRYALLVYRRALIAYVLRVMGYSYTQIGDVICRDHSDCIHLVIRYRERKRAKDGDYGKIIGRVRAASATLETENRKIYLTERIRKLTKELQKIA